MRSTLNNTPTDARTRLRVATGLPWKCSMTFFSRVPHSLVLGPGVVSDGACELECLRAELTSEYLCWPVTNHLVHAGELKRLQTTGFSPTSLTRRLHQHPAATNHGGDVHLHQVRPPHLREHGKKNVPLGQIPSRPPCLLLRRHFFSSKGQ